MAVLVKYGLEEVADLIRLRVQGKAHRPIYYDTSSPAKYHTRPVRVRLVLEELGPTFIKFGQLLSTRPDLIPHDYVVELARLQDQVAPADPNQIIQTIEQELGRPIKELFLRFENDPIAAGSIAQVHRAQLPDKTEVVIKVLRPGIRQLVRTECQIIKELASLLQGTIWEGQGLDLVRMADDLTEAIIRETDLANERRNILRFAKAFESDPAIHIPRVFEPYCTDTVLTMEYIDGIKPSPVEALARHGLDQRLIARRGADFVLRQVFELWIFHSDPHPGNFFVLPDNVLCPIDFGQVAVLPSTDRRLIGEILHAIMLNDGARIVSILDGHQMLEEQTDHARLSAEIEQLIANYRNLPLKDIPFNQIFTQVFDLIRTHKVRTPARFSLMLKSLATIESFGKSLDPDFNMAQAITPYVRQILTADLKPKRLWQTLQSSLYRATSMALQLPQDAELLVRKMRLGRIQVRVHHEHLENLTKTLDKSSNRISFALIIAALLVASSLLVPQEGKALGFISLQTLGVAGYVVAAILGIWLVASIIRSGRL
jgi:ubiquinone biosynthesis protein